ncbi:MAG: S-methyl-5-thioribose-1-phosphate isomerase [Candidatus Omnitrophica bacterium]|nr:S-methyl-5-thioribose-1-phosphate isomerase [Candidatus Omnitrophota bacterium]
MGKNIVQSKRLRVKVALPEPPVRTLWWDGKELCLLDQRVLPGRERVLRLKTAASVYQAIRSLQVRGAPAIGVTAAFGVALEARRFKSQGVKVMRRKAEQAIELLEKARPTAYNLFFALNRMKEVLSNSERTPEKIMTALVSEAEKIYLEDLRSGWEIGLWGKSLVKPGMNILTHCNAGGLATSGFGTALAICYAAWNDGIRFHVYVDETRPVLQGARLTAYELQKAGIPCTLICDNMAAFLMSERKVDLVVVGADRIAANGDTANKIGTYGLAVLSRWHQIPFYVAAPLSTFHPEIATGLAIPIEERDPDEVTTITGKRVAPKGVKVYNPAFDVTPGRLITGFITERGIIRPPYPRSLSAIFRKG